MNASAQVERATDSGSLPDLLMKTAVDESWVLRGNGRAETQNQDGNMRGDKSPGKNWNCYLYFYQFLQVIQVGLFCWCLESSVHDLWPRCSSLKELQELQ